MPDKDKKPTIEDLLGAYDSMLKKPEPVKKDPFKDPEFKCLACGYQFGKDDVKQLRVCKLCKTPNQIIRQWELLTESQKEFKYSPNLKDQIIGPSSKHVVGNQIRAARSGKLK